MEQAKNSQGNLDADVRAEANNTYWTRTAWQERGLAVGQVVCDHTRTITQPPRTGAETVVRHRMAFRRQKSCG